MHCHVRTPGVTRSGRITDLREVLGQRRDGAAPLEFIGRVVPTRTEGINPRSVFRFPVER
jgi:hypothetical protein